MQRIEIYDKYSKDRFLGTIEQPFDRPLGARFSMALCRPFAIFDPHLTGPPPAKDYAAPFFSQVDFDLDWRITEDGWWKYIVFLTNAPLSDLKHLKTFRYPDESEEASYFRQRYDL